MKRTLILLVSTLLLASLTYTIAQNTILSSVSEITVEDVEALSSGETSCKGPHKNGCHSGGENSSSCSIGASFHVCIGGLGGNCSTSCFQGSYACCGLDCKCIPDGQ